MKFAVFLSLLGAAVSIYLAILGCLGNYCPYLPFDERIPAIFGFFWFISAILIFKFEKIKIYWLLFGILGISVLLAMSVAYSYFCPLCSLTHVIGLLIIIIVLINKR